MGVDCYLYLNNKKPILLDRWYVFSDEFVSGKEYSKDEALKRLNFLDEKAQTKYSRTWIQKARDEIKESNSCIFYSELEL